MISKELHVLYEDEVGSCLVRKDPVVYMLMNREFSNLSWELFRLLWKLRLLAVTPLFTLEEDSH